MKRLKTPGDKYWDVGSGLLPAPAIGWRQSSLMLLTIRENEVSKILGILKYTKSSLLIPKESTAIAKVYFTLTPASTITSFD